MRIDYRETNHGKTGRVPSGLNASTIWTLTGVALLTACAHDGSPFLESGGGESGESSESSATFNTIATVVAFGLGIAAGDSDSGSTSNIVSDDPPPAPFALQLPPDPHVYDGVAQETANEQQEVNSEVAGGRFSASAPQGMTVIYSAAHGGASSEPVPGAPALKDTVTDLISKISSQQQAGPSYSPAASSSFGAASAPQFNVEGEAGSGSGSAPEGETRYDRSSFNYDRQVKGDHGTLYYNSATGTWTYRPGPDKVNPLKDGEEAEDNYDITAQRDDGETASDILSIKIIGKTERSEAGEAEFNIPALRVGDQLVVRLSDNDGIPQDDPSTVAREVPAYTFYLADDAQGTNKDEIGAQYTSVPASDMGVVNVVQAHVGKFVGVEVEYTDANGNSEVISKWTSTAVAAYDAPGVARFEGTPEVGETITVRLDDPNFTKTGMEGSYVYGPNQVTYQFFYSDNAPADSSNLQNAVNIGSAAAVSSGAARGFATSPDIPGAAANKYIGARISYTDAEGTADVVYVYTEETTAPDENVEPGAYTAPNYGPKISTLFNEMRHLYAVFPQANVGHESGLRYILFGERGWQTDPQHTRNEHLLITFENVVSDNVTGTMPSTMAASDAAFTPEADRSNVLIDHYRGTDQHVDTEYGTWRFNRVDEDHNRRYTEEEGVIIWTYQPGATGAQRLKVENIAEGVRIYDQMFLRVSDGVDSEVVRLVAEIRHNNLGEDNPAARLTKHVGEDTGAAPTLGPQNEVTDHMATSVYYEGGQVWGWDNLNVDFSRQRELNFGDYDTDDGDLTIAFHADYRGLDHNGNGETITPEEFVRDRRYTDIDGTLGHLTDVQQTTAQANGWRPGDVADVGTNRITADGNQPDQWTKIWGFYGNFYVRRFDEHATREAEGRDETGVLIWTYDLGGDSPDYTAIDYSDSRDIRPHYHNVTLIPEGELAFDILHLQVSDDDGNKSDVRTILVPIYGMSGLRAGILTGPQLIMGSLDSYDNIFEGAFDPATAPVRARPESASGYFDGDAGGDEAHYSGTISYDVV